jgi:hypothetical protein
MQRDIEFRTEDGAVLRGWSYLAERAGPAPTVIMAQRAGVAAKTARDATWGAF